MMDLIVAKCMSSLIVELCSELDLHYGDEEFFALTPTFEKLGQAALDEQG